MWVIESINPDGNVLGTHQNARGVDLNRNFDPVWQANDCAVVVRYCAGTGPRSEPESQAIADFILKIKPKMTAWYHGPLHVVDKALQYGVANPAVLERLRRPRRLLGGDGELLTDRHLRRQRHAVRELHRARVVGVRRRAADRRGRRAHASRA